MNEAERPAQSDREQEGLDPARMFSVDRTQQSFPPVNSMVRLSDGTAYREFAGWNVFSDGQLAVGIRLREAG